MARGNKKQDYSGWIEDIDSVSIFGKCKAEELVSVHREKEERERKFIEAQCQREQELKKEQQIKKDQEMSYQLFLEQELEDSRKTGKKTKSRGRGSLLNQPLVSSNDQKRGRGRGCLPHKERIPGTSPCLPLFVREEKVQFNIDRFTNSNLYSNNVQKMYWSELASSNKQKEEEEEEEEEYRLTPENYHRYTPDSVSTSEQFEDAFSTPQSTTPESFNSAPSSSRCSPMSPANPSLEASASPDIQGLTLRQRSETTPSTPQRSKPRGNRIAAKFHNSFEDAETPVNNIKEQFTQSYEPIDSASEKKENTFELPGSSQAPPPSNGFVKNRRRVGSTLFKDLNSSQRVLSNNILRPEDLYAGNFVNKGFNLDVKDFPAL